MQELTLRVKQNPGTIELNFEEIKCSDGCQVGRIQGCNLYGR